MTKEITPRQRVMTALHSGKPDKIPFTIYKGHHISQSTSEKELRNRGLCIVERFLRSYKIHHPNVKIESKHYKDSDGKDLILTIYTTPYGDLTTLEEPFGFTTWRHEGMFKSSDDYKKILYFIKDTIVESNYDEAEKSVKDLGEDFIVIDNLPQQPMQNLVGSSYMKDEIFCIEWMDNRDEILKLYEALLVIARKIYPIVANSPIEICAYGGNVTPQIIGVENFEKYYVPNYNEAAEMLHKKGKLIGTHLDGDNTLIMSAVAKTKLDYIEAYDAGIGPSVKEAKKYWQNKVLWINYPSAWHLKPVEEVRKNTIKLIEEASPGNGFIIGITESVPEERRKQNFSAIMDGIDEVTDF